MKKLKVNKKNVYNRRKSKKSKEILRKSREIKEIPKISVKSNGFYSNNPYELTFVYIGLP